MYIIYISLLSIFFLLKYYYTWYIYTKCIINNATTTKNINIFVEYNFFLVVFCCLVGGSFLKIAGI